jgi:hypothetical protein
MKDLKSLNYGTLVVLKPDATFYRNDFNPYVFVVPNRETTFWINESWHPLHCRAALYLKRNENRTSYVILIDGTVSITTSDTLMRLVLG